MKLKYRITATVLSAVMAFGTLSAAAAAVEKDVDYTITTPYTSVDWDSWGQYTASMHNHTNVTDGENPFNDMVLKHYDLNYDFLAITDHSTQSYSWTEPNYVPAIRAAMCLRTGANPLLEPVGLTDEEYLEVTTPGADGKSMLQVPFGIEHNGLSFNNTHVNSWFVDCGNGDSGASSDYETSLSAVEKLGGVSVINHPGEYTGARNEDDPEKAYNADYEYYIQKYANLLLKYPSCVGIDVNSKGDWRTRHDRKLWDQLLQRVIPGGRNVYAMATSDAHRDSAIDTGFTVHLMPEKTVDGLRASLENGTFFAMSHNNQNPKELALYSSELGEELGVNWSADKSLPDPKVTNIVVNDDEDCIALTVENARIVHWIADGEVIATGDTIDLDDYSDKIGSYVRAEVFGDGGILYTQAFMLDYGDAPQTDDDDAFFDFGSILKRILDIIRVFIANNEIFRALNEWLFAQKY